jgi:exocyst complex component 2
MRVAKSSGWETWQAITEFVKSVSDVMLANLPNFWKIGKAYLDGKYKKVGYLYKLHSIYQTG